MLYYNYMYMLCALSWLHLRSSTSLYRFIVKATTPAQPTKIRDIYASLCIYI